MCPKCAINKAGKRSCCARGGTWFKNCGDTGDTTVDYTWAEGIQACRSALQAVVSSLKAPLEEVHPLDNNKPRNNTQQQTDNYRSIGISNAENSKVVLKLRKFGSAFAFCLSLSDCMSILYFLVGMAIDRHAK